MDAASLDQWRCIDDMHLQRMIIHAFTLAIEGMTNSGTCKVRTNRSCRITGVEGLHSLYFVQKHRGFHMRTRWHECTSRTSFLWIPQILDGKTPFRCMDGRAGAAMDILLRVFEAHIVVRDKDLLECVHARS